jgi:putative transposase
VEPASLKWQEWTHGNGKKTKNIRGLVTRVGKIELQVPQDRQGRFSTKVFERYQRSERAFVTALSEMYILGVFTRKVTKITEQLCGHEVSASTISTLNRKLDTQLQLFAQRRLDRATPLPEHGSAQRTP